MSYLSSSNKGHLRIPNNTSKQFTHALNYCLDKLKLSKHYLSNVDNETISRRATEFGEIMHQFMLEIIREMSTCDSSNSVDYNEPSNTLTVEEEEEKEDEKEKKNTCVFDSSPPARDTEHFKHENLLDKEKMIIETDENKLDDGETEQVHQDIYDYSTVNLRRKTRSSNSAIKYSPFFKNSLSDDETEASSNSDTNESLFSRLQRQEKSLSFDTGRSKYITMDEKVMVVDTWKSNPTWSMKKIREATGVRQVTKTSKIREWEKIILHYQTMIIKFKQLNDWVYAECLKQKAKHKTISDPLIRRLGQKSKKVNNYVGTEFKANEGWCYFFKKRYGITGEDFCLQIAKPNPNSDRNSLCQAVSPTTSLQAEQIDKSKLTNDDSASLLDTNPSTSLSVDEQCSKSSPKTNGTTEISSTSRSSDEKNNKISSSCLSSSLYEAIPSTSRRGYEQNDKLDSNTNDEDEEEEEGIYCSSSDEDMEEDFEEKFGYYNPYDDDEDEVPQKKIKISSVVSFAKPSGSVEILSSDEDVDENMTYINKIVLPSMQKLQKEVPFEKKQYVVNLVKENPSWTLETLKKQSGCEELMFLTQLYEWKKQVDIFEKNASKK